MINLITAILNTAIYSSMVMLFVIAVRAIFKDRLSSRIVAFLWTLVVIRLLLPVNILSPLSIYDIFPVPETVSTYEGNDTQPTSGTYFSVPAETNIDIGNESYSDIGVVEYDTPNEISNKTTYSENIISRLKKVNFSEAAFFVWLAGMAYFLVRLSIKAAIFNLKIKNCKIITNPEIQRLLSKNAKMLSIKYKVQIRSCPYVDTPVAYGLIKPKILMPFEYENQMEHKKLDMIVLHELCHIKRLDILKNYFWLIAKIIYWFNPLVAIAFKLYGNDVEHSCDEMVVRHISQDMKLLYSQCLLDTIRGSVYKKADLSPIVLSFAKRESYLYKRVKNIIIPKAKSNLFGGCVIFLSLVMVFACFTTACQPTPDSEVVIGKNNLNNAIEATQNPDESGIEISQDTKVKWTSSTEINSDQTYSVDINIDAIRDIIPENICVTEVVPTDFNTTQAQAAVDVLMGEEYYYGAATQEDLLMAMTGAQLRLNQIEQGFIDNTDGGDMSDFWYEYYEERMDNASKENTEGKVEFRDELSGERQISQIKIKHYPSSNAIGYLSVTNNSLIQTSLSYWQENYDIAYDITNVGYNGQSAYDMEMSYEDALKLAYDAIYKIDGTQEMEHVFTVYGQGRSYYDSRRGYDQLPENPEYGQCYVMYFSRKYEPLQTIIAEKAPVVYSEGKDAEPLFSEPWPAEYIRVIVDDTGIVQFFWTSPCETINVLNENVAMLPFEDVLELFKSNIYYSSIWSSDNGAQVIINIDDIELGLVRIPKQDDYGKFIVTPVWNFMGYKQTTFADGSIDEHHSTEEGSRNSFILINAIDGSIIDPLLQ